MPLNRKLSILIVDADFLGREALKRILGHEYRDIEFGEAGTTREALAHIKATPWRLVVLDVRLPDKEGFVVLQEIRTRRPGTSVLVRSIHPESVHGPRSLRLGASGYISKSGSPRQLVAAVRSVLAGKPHFSDSLRREVDSAAKSQSELSAQERTVFLALAEGRSIAEIAASLALNAKTVSTYKRRIFNKLHLESTADLVRYQIEHKLSEQ